MILSGGASSRMGRPKALLTWEGEAFLRRLWRILTKHCAPVVIVTGAHDAEIRAALPELTPYLRCNERYEDGQFSSLRFGLSHFPESPGVVYWPVDYPAVAEETVRELLRYEGVGLAKPRFQGKSGHPILLGPEAQAALLAAAATSTARDVLQGIAARKFDVEDRYCMWDVDTPEDYAALLAAKDEVL